MQIFIDRKKIAPTEVVTNFRSRAYVYFYATIIYNNNNNIVRKHITFNFATVILVIKVSELLQSPSYNTNSRFAVLKYMHY